MTITLIHSKTTARSSSGKFTPQLSATHSVAPLHFIDIRAHFSKCCSKDIHFLS